MVWTIWPEMAESVVKSILRHLPEFRRTSLAAFSIVRKISGAVWKTVSPFPYLTAPHLSPVAGCSSVPPSTTKQWAAVTSPFLIILYSTWNFCLEWPLQQGQKASFKTSRDPLCSPLPWPHGPLKRDSVNTILSQVVLVFRKREPW